MDREGEGTAVIHLRLRTEYSFGQTFAPVERLIERLKAIGCTAAGIVDGSTWGHVRWFNACREAGIQPLLGWEVAVAEDGSETAPRMWALAKNEAGLRQAYRLASKSHRLAVLTRRGAVPRLRPEDVVGSLDGLIWFAGEVTDSDLLVEAGAVLDLSPASRVLNAKKLQIAARHSLPVVSVCDNAYAFEEDRETFELVTKAGLKVSPQHILDRLDHQDVAANIAAQCSALKLPVAPMIHFEGNLEALCREGIKFRKIKWTKAYEERLKHELSLIKSKNFESYFLIVSDMVRHAKQHMLVGPSRGSAAGSLVCYLSRITEIDPIPPGLFFERFIDVSRSDLPDIDLDFPDDKRATVFEYMSKKYGSENTAKIGTISEFKPKSALIQVCKALGIPPQATAAVKVAMIERTSADSRANNCLEDTFDTTSPGKAFIKAYPQARAACLIEGHASHTGVHAAGLIVCGDEITNYATVDANGIAHIDKGSAETLGLLKIDVLGLRTLGILEDSGIKVDWYNLKFDDQEVYEVFNKGRMCGIFQFEGNALREISRRIEFKTLREIDAVTALARPGPFGGGVTEEYLQRMTGKKYSAIHPLVERHMAESYGLPIYQEQTLAIVREIGKFNWKDTSTIRKAMSKRMGKEFFEKFWELFRTGAKEQGISEKDARATWELINSMGAWQMNKAHTFSYAVISYWTAWLKAHHPLEFAAANLRSAKDEDSAVQLLREMVNEGFKYKPFDLELSEVNWSVKNGELVGGFLVLHGFGEVKAKKFVELRNAGKLTTQQKEEALKAQNIFADLFPMQTRYAHIYADPNSQNVSGEVSKIGEFDGTQEGSFVFIGEVVYKNPRNANEDVNVKKRGGKMETGPLEFIDVRLRDDTGIILARVGRFDYEKMGREINEKIPVGAHLLVRARFSKGFRFGFIQRWKRLDNG